MVVVDLQTFRFISSYSTRKNQKRTRYENTCSLRDNITFVAVFCGLFQLTKWLISVIWKIFNWLGMVVDSATDG